MAPAVDSDRRNPSEFSNVFPFFYSRPNIAAVDQRTFVIATVLLPVDVVYKCRQQNNGCVCLSHWCCHSYHRRVCAVLHQV